MSETEAERITVVLKRLAEAIQPKRVLLVGADPQHLRTCFTERTAVTALAADRALERVSREGVHDLAVVDSGAGIPDGRIGALLSQLRDVHARRVLVLVRPQSGEGWGHRVLVGYGFTPFGGAVDREVPLRLYQFDIATYKTTPDWLGPQNWANPEMWDKYRW